MRWQVRKAGRVVRSQGGKGVSVVKWERWESGEVARWGGGGFLVLFKSGGRRVSPRFHFFSF